MLRYSFLFPPLDVLNFYTCSKAAHQLVNFVPAGKLFTSYIVPNESYNLVTAAELILNLLLI